METPASSLKLQTSAPEGQKATWTVHRDGTFDIANDHIKLRNAWPALDHEPIHPLEVQASHDRVRYRLADDHAVELRFGRDGDAIWIEVELCGMETTPRWVHPLAGGQIEGATRLFRTGIGFSGPTGFVELTGREELFSIESYLFTALIDSTGTGLVVAARDVGDFMQKCHLENRVHRHQFRNREIDRNALYFEAGFSTEEIPVPGKRLCLPRLWITTGAEAWAALRDAADAVGRSMRSRLGAPRYHYCSWYNRASHFNQSDLDQLLTDFAASHEPLQAIQIDDGHQRFLGDWLDPFFMRWPGGMERAAKAIIEKGYVPGIWVGPFMVGDHSRIAREHPDWLLHWADGSRIVPWKRYDGTHEEQEVYVLDTSHPEALAYLEHVFRTFRSWGFRLFKTDFLEWGWKDSTRVRRHTPGKTSTQYFRDALTAIRRAIGDESYWLGCITYFAPCIGLLDGMRVASDVGVTWNTNDGGTGNDGTGGGTQNSVEETYHCQFFNNVLWQNDPDVTFLRDNRIFLSESEVQALAFFNGILGVSLNTSDDIPDVPERRRKLWQFLRPQTTPWTARLPYVAGGSRLKVAVRDFSTLGTHAVVLLNDSLNAVAELLKVRDWIGRDTAFLFEWGPTGARPLGEQAEWLARLPAHQATLLYLALKNTPPPPTLTLGGWLAENMHPTATGEVL